MKSKRDILIRAIILVCMSDRGFWEFEKLGGKLYSREFRDDHRKLVYEEFLKEKGFVDYMTEEEISVFEEPVGGKNAYKIMEYRLQDEALSSLLWALNLREMPDWLTLSEEDYHPLLRIDVDNDLEELMASCELRSEEEVALQTEVAMLWHWRSRETTFVPPEGKTWSDCIKDIFGEQYEDVLAQIPRSRRAPGDFKIGKKTVSRLGKYDRYVYETIAYWRHVAFEWIMGEEDWDEVSADT